MNPRMRKIQVGKAIAKTNRSGAAIFKLNQDQIDLVNSARYKAYNFAERTHDGASFFKRKLTSRLFWGRSNLYRNISHFFIGITTFIIAITGVAYQIQASGSENNLDFGQNISGQEDLLHQGGSIETVLVQNPQFSSIKTYKHKVKSGENLKSIAANYNVTPDTIRWASSDVMSPFTDKIEPGWVLTVPEMNGVLYEVRARQTLESIIAEVSVKNSEANRFNIIEFNNLKQPVKLKAGQLIFIPDGNLRDDRLSGSLAQIPKGVFIDPLTHKSCAGYHYQRGFLGYHDGVDLSKWDGCPISAVANGLVVYAGWGAQGQGYMVEIDHGGGITTKYFHGNGVFWVKTGERVKQGQSIMYMGDTGYATGVHLHFSLWKDGISVDPSGFIPYRNSF